MEIYSLKTQALSTLSVVLCLLLVQSVDAAERAHEHGVGRIYIAVDGNDVEVEMTIPGADTVGFEHTASSQGEKRTVIKAIEALRNVNKIIKLSPEAMCRVEAIEVHSGLVDDKIEDASHDHVHGHKNKSKNEDFQKEVHSDFIANYHFHCEKPLKLDRAQVGLFIVFPSALELKAKWVTPNGQGTAELTAKSPSLTF